MCILQLAIHTIRGACPELARPEVPPALPTFKFLLRSVRRLAGRSLALPPSAAPMPGNRPSTSFRCTVPSASPRAAIFARSAQDLSFLADQLLPVDKSVSHVVQRKPRIAWTPAPIDEQPDAGALRAVEAAVEALEESGFNVEKVALPRVFGQSHLTARKVMYKEIAGSLQAELSEGEEGIYRTELILAQKGSEISWNEYIEAQTEIDEVRCSFAETMAGYDAFLTLSQAEEAPVSEGVAGQPIFNIPWSVSTTLPDTPKSPSHVVVLVQAMGVPVVNVPGWAGDSSMPIGVSLIGRHYEDGALLKLAELVGDVFERKGNWKSRV